MFFQNPTHCQPFAQFIAQTLEDRLRNGSLRLWGKIGECQLPKVVMPLVVEPSKPRLCHDERFVNLWIRDLPFSLETLKDVPRIVDKGSLMFYFDDKSGYDHVFLSEDSQTYFGLEFGGYVMNYPPFWVESFAVYLSDDWYGSDRLLSIYRPPNTTVH